jgi:uroporphyrinogen III methyltransferase/synthase
MGLAEPLEALGAEVLALPVMAVVDPPDPEAVAKAVASLRTYHWVVLTSTNSVDRFFDAVAAVDPTLGPLGGVQMAAVGKATAKRMRSRGVEPDLIPAYARAEGLVNAFRELGVGEGWHVLIPRALKAREVFPEALREMGAQVDVVPVYQTVPVDPDPDVLERLRAGTIDCVTFTSGAIAQMFVEVIREAGIDPEQLMNDVAIASIGPITTRALAALGYEEDIQSERQTMSSLASAIADYFTEQIDAD